jgi:hypothetical protein
MEARGEFPHRDSEDIYSRILRAIPIAPIKQLLRIAKEGRGGDLSDIRITSANKEMLVQKNVRSAVTVGALEPDRLEGLIQEYEESGNQRIFLYSLGKKENASNMAFPAVFARLFRGKKPGQIDFPIFHFLPHEPAVSSFREYRSEGAEVQPLGFTPRYSEGWLLRLDASAEIDEPISRQELESGIRAVTYAPQLRNAVCVVRYWSGAHLLEIRVPNLAKRPASLDLRDKIKEKFEGAIQFSAFEEFGLAQACTKIMRALLHEPGQEPGVRRIAGSLLREREGSTRRSHRKSYQGRSSKW